MSYDLLLHNATIVTPEGIRPGAVAVQSGRIAAVLPPGRMPDAATVIDAQGAHLLPGVIDLHVHFREPGQEYKATYRSESSAAALGGVTTICDMPNNGDRAIVNVERFLAKQAVAARSSYVDFGIYAYLTARSPGEVQPLVDAGVMGFKWDMSLAGTEVAPGVILPIPEHALPYFQAARAVGATIGIHAEDRPLVLRRIADLRGTGRQDVSAHLDSRPPEAEAIALRQAIALARESGVRLHVHHLSSAEGVRLVREAKEDGMAITAETIPPFLFLDADDYPRLGTVMKIYPAVKYRADRDALWEGLRDGTVDCVATDHAPHTSEEKLRSVWEASAGAIGVQTSLSLMLTAVSHGKLGLERCVELLTAAPARCYGLYPRKGAIVEGADADLVLVDLAAAGTIRNEDMATPNHLTPFDGWHIQGLPLITILRGEVVMRDGKVVGKAGAGVLVRPGSGTIRTQPPAGSGPAHGEADLA